MGPADKSRRFFCAAAGSEKNARSRGASSPRLPESEHPLEDGANQRRPGAQRREEGVGVGKAQTAGEAVQRGGFVRQRVRLRLVFDLQAVLDQPEERIGLGQCLEFRGGQKLQPGQRREHAGGVRFLQEGVLGAMEQLERARDEFDFADAARAELHVAARRGDVGAVNLLLDARLEIADLDEHVGRDGPREDKRLQALAEFVGDLHVARDAARLDQREALPGLPVAGVVILRVVQRGDQRSVLPLGSQAKIHAEERPGRLVRGEGADEFFAETRVVLVV